MRHTLDHKAATALDLVTKPTVVVARPDAGDDRELRVARASRAVLRHGAKRGAALMTLTRASSTRIATERAIAYEAPRSPS